MFNKVGTKVGTKELTMETIIEVLIRRDGFSEDDAENAVKEFEDLVEEMIDDGCDLLDLEQELLDTFGLEPDYLMEVMPV